MMRIVVFSPSQAQPSGLDSLPGAQITVISRAFGTAEHGGLVVVPARTGLTARLDALALRSALGRALRRVTPLDPGVVFWRDSCISPAARAAIESADLLVSTERDAQYAAWRWARALRHRSPAPAAVSGMLAARGHLRAVAPGRIDNGAARGWNGATE